MKIAVIGLGFVGLSLSSVLASKGLDIIGIDIDEEKCKKIINGISPFFEPELDKVLQNGLKKKLKVSSDFSLIKNCDFIFVTVSTPQNTNGSIDLTIIKKAVTSLGENLLKNKKKPIIFIKSTVIPGTIEKIIIPILEKKSNKKDGKGFGLISNPEFLQESSAIRDTKFPHVIILGSNQSEFMRKAKKIFIKLHPNVPIITTNHQTAEMIKYTNNSFLATKISFINQISNICQSIPGANVEDVARAIGLDPRIGSLFLNAGPGYGGSCLPKDVKAIINFSNKIGVKPVLLDAVETVNDYQLENLVLTIKNALGKIRDKKITVLGLAFKADTDDIRDSVSIKLIHLLLKSGVKITVHDPKAIHNTKRIFGDKISYSDSIYSALKGSECGVIVTPWKEYSKLNEKHLKIMKKRIIVDSRRMLNPNLNMYYYPIGIGKIKS